MTSDVQMSRMQASDTDLEAVVRIEDVSKDFGSLTAVDDVSLSIREGEFLTILGPSGAGKTTLLHMIAGFHKPTQGEIYINDNPVSDKAPYERDIGLVFQNLALFPHMTVGENIAFPLKMGRVNIDDIDSQVKEVLDLVRLPHDYQNKRVGELSGGQQQRVAFARSLVYEPTLLLLDEPLSSLDKKLRDEMRNELARIHDETGVTIVHVTHNQTEALSMAERIAVINDGRLEQVSPSQTLYSQPATPFVADFIGNTNMMDGTVEEVDGSEATINVGGLLIDVETSENLRENQHITLGIRAEQVDISGSNLNAGNDFAANVKHVSFEGDQTEYVVELENHNKDFAVTKQDPEPNIVFDRGDQVYIGWSTNDTFVFP